MRRLLLAAAGLIAAAMFAAFSAPAAPRPGDFPDAQIEHLSIPHPDAAVDMRVTVIRPRRAGPFPLALINHGSSEDAGWRAAHEVPAYKALVKLLLAQGYAVAIPQRPGHGRTGGPYLEGIGQCDGADFARSGHVTARAIFAVVQHLRAQPFVRNGRVVLIGHSAGGWGALALASRFPEMVESVVVFAGGRGGRSHDMANTNCAPQNLIAAAGDFGRTTRVPSLWSYAENDSYFGPALAKAMADAYRAAGAPLDFRMLPPVGAEGHFAIELDAAAKIWLPIVDRFIRRHRASSPVLSVTRRAPQAASFLPQGRS
jgi:dienelactone hydrolase